MGKPSGPKLLVKQLEDDPHASRLRLHRLKGQHKDKHAISLTYAYRIVWVDLAATQLPDFEDATAWPQQSIPVTINLHCVRDAVVIIIASGNGIGVGPHIHGIQIGGPRHAGVCLKTRAITLIGVDEAQALDHHPAVYQNRRPPRFVVQVHGKPGPAGGGQFHPAPHHIVGKNVERTTRTTFRIVHRDKVVGVDEHQDRHIGARSRHQHLGFVNPA